MDPDVRYQGTAVAYAIACATASGAVLLAGETNTQDAMFWGAAGTLAAGVERWRRGWSIEVLGVLYVSLSAGLLASMRSGDHGLQAVILLFAIVWAADTLAYIVGTWLGGPKLIPQASPNKTWSGFIAGLAAGTGRPSSPDWPLTSISWPWRCSERSWPWHR